MAKMKDHSKHDYIVKSFAGVLRSDRFKNIKTEINGCEKPKKLYWKNSEIGYTPDITAIYDKTYSSPEEFIFEVETEKTLVDPLTDDKWQLFATFSEGFRRRFIVIVPKEYKQKALEKAKEISVKLWSVWTLDS